MHLFVNHLSAGANRIYTRSRSGFVSIGPFVFPCVASDGRYHRSKSVQSSSSTLLRFLLRSKITTTTFVRTTFDLGKKKPNKYKATKLGEDAIDVDEARWKTLLGKLLTRASRNDILEQGAHYCWGLFALFEYYVVLFFGGVDLSPVFRGPRIYWEIRAWERTPYTPDAHARTRQTYLFSLSLPGLSVYIRTYWKLTGNNSIRTFVRANISWRVWLYTPRVRG